MSLNLDTPSGLEILGPDYPGIEKILTKECLALVAELDREFRQRKTWSSSRKIEKTV